MNSDRVGDARVAYLDGMRGAPAKARVRGSFRVQGAVCFTTQSETAFRASGAMVS